MITLDELQHVRNHLLTIKITECNETRREPVYEMLNKITMTLSSEKVPINPKSLWANLKQLLPKSTSTSTLSVMLGDAEVSDPLGISSAFNTFFTTVGSDLAKQFANQADPPVIPSSGYEPFKFKLITASEVMTLLSELSISKAQGTDGIMARSLKVAANELSFPLATIFNFSLLTGTIPSEWKQAVVTPVFKEGDRQNTSNYRPISVLCVAHSDG